MNRLLQRVAQVLPFVIAATPIAWQPALAADGAMSSSQSRMSVCAKQNKGKTGDDYKKAQSDCLKGNDAVAATPMTQQQKMAMCSKQNKGRTGDDYRKAQSDCLKA